MALNIAISKSDLAKNIPVSDGWTEFEVGTPYAKPTKDGSSVNYMIPCAVVGDPNQRVIDHLFSAKALGMMAPFLAALKGCTVQEMLDQITSGAINIDLEGLSGKHIMGKVKQDLYEGRITSKIVDWATPGKVPF
jgi:hypothetical protein